MIVHRVHLQAFECDVCHKVREIPKAVLSDPYELTLMRERFAKSHVACEEKRKLQQTPVSGGVQ